ncbi:MAG: hypothetical protein FJ398_06520 [Verrucomicrobia bacterium]|nr:hypothetical protein [Verrucomicrobiota bacterium]
MPTPSEELRSAECGVRNESPRSVFGNFKTNRAPGPLTPVHSSGESPRLSPPHETDSTADYADNTDKIASSSAKSAESVVKKPIQAFNVRNGSENSLREGEGEHGVGIGLQVETLQNSIDRALARSFLYRILAKAYEYPTEEGWNWLAQPTVQGAFWTSVLVLTCDPSLPVTSHEAQGGASLSSARRTGRVPGSSSGSPGRTRPTVSRGAPAPARVSAGALPADAVSAPRAECCLPAVPDGGEAPQTARGARALLESSLRNRAGQLLRHLQRRNFEPFLQDYIAVFGHAARGSCPLNEIEYGDLKADPLFQPHRLADLAAYYRAFGLEITEDATERPDHICIELEFMSVLAAKEAYALEHQLDDLELPVCRDAQKGFLREHLGRWTPAFARRLARVAGEGVLGALAEFTLEFIEEECRRLGVAAGSEDLLLRPVDEADESLCASCGIRSLPPGATAVT